MFVNMGLQYVEKDGVENYVWKCPNSCLCCCFPFLQYNIT